MVFISRGLVWVFLFSIRVFEVGFGFMLVVFICFLKISFCRYVEGRKIRRAVFLGLLILITCLRGKVDGFGIEVVYYYVSGSRTFLGYVAGFRFFRRFSGYGGVFVCRYSR